MKNTYKICNILHKKISDDKYQDKKRFYILNPYDLEGKLFIFWKYFLFVWDSETELIQFFKNPEIEGGDLEGW